MHDIDSKRSFLSFVELLSLLKSRDIFPVSATYKDCNLCALTFRERGEASMAVTLIGGDSQEEVYRDAWVDSGEPFYCNGFTIIHLQADNRWS